MSEADGADDVASPRSRNRDQDYLPDGNRERRRREAQRRGMTIQEYDERRRRQMVAQYYANGDGD
jgi:hypothetical protein